VAEGIGMNNEDTERQIARLEQQAAQVQRAANAARDRGSTPALRREFDRLREIQDQIESARATLRGPRPE
jgi:flagellar biosynthesis/type III secretory pathway chaperone